MSDANELRRAKFLLIAGILFLVSAFMSWTELQYLLFGSSAEAEIVRVVDREEYVRRGRRREVRDVSYKWTENGGAARTGKATVSGDWTPPESGTVRIQYFSGESAESRIAGINWVPVIMFATALGFLTWKGVVFWREFKEHERRMARQR